MADVKSTYNGEHSRKAMVNLDKSIPLKNMENGMASMDINSGTGEVFKGSPNDAKKMVKIVRQGGKMC